MATGFSAINQLNSQSKKGVADKPKACFRTKDLDIDNIYANDLNPYGQQEIEQKATEILVLGLLQPLEVVYAQCDQGEYRIIGGERRWRALKSLVSAGHTEFKRVTCQIRTPANKNEEIIEIIISNSHRRKSIKEEMQEVQILHKTMTDMKEAGETIKGLSLKSGKLRDIIADLLGKSGTKVANIQNVNNNLLPELKEMLYEGEITFSTAVELAGLTKEQQQDLKESGRLILKEVKKAKEEWKAEKKKKDPIPGQMDITDIKGAMPEPQEPDEEENEEYEEERGTEETDPPEASDNPRTAEDQEPQPDQGKKEEDDTQQDTKNEGSKSQPPESDAGGTIQQQITQGEINRGDPPKMRGKKVHKVKTSSQFFPAAKSRMKPFELRINDRDYQVGDMLEQEEYKDGERTGEKIYQEIIYVLEDYKGLEPGYCILGTKLIEREKKVEKKNKRNN